MGQHLHGGRVLVPTLLLLLSAGPAQACPSGYESTERLVKRADHILEVEVLEVSDEPLPDHRRATATDGVYGEFADARARVRVVRESRGRLPVREFTLVGGPYRSCALFSQLIHFTKGEHLTLILEGPFPDTLETVVIRWRCRCTSETLEEVQETLDRVRAAWQRRMDHLRRIAPSAVAAAEGATQDPGALRSLPFPALAALAERLRDPARPAPAGGACADPRVVVAGQGPSTFSGSRSVLPEVVREELNRRIESTPDEVSAFHREFLRSWLVAELRVPEPLARRFARAVKRSDLLRITLPLDALEIEDEQDRALASVRGLLRLSHDEPDPLVWSGAGPLDPVVCGPWLERHADELPRDWTHLQILLHVPCPQTASYVYRAWAAEENPARYDEYLAFFEALGDETTAQQVRERQAEAEAAKPE